MCADSHISLKYRNVLLFIRRSQYLLNIDRSTQIKIEILHHPLCRHLTIRWLVIANNGARPRTILDNTYNRIGAVILAKWTRRARERQIYIEAISCACTAWRHPTADHLSPSPLQPVPIMRHPPWRVLAAIAASGKVCPRQRALCPQRQRCHVRQSLLKFRPLFSKIVRVRPKFVSWLSATR